MENPLNKFTKKDLYFSIITGLLTGFLAWKIFIFLELPEFVGISYAWLTVLIPILWILGVNLGYFLGQWLGFFDQFGKFSAIGFTNAAVYFGILNILIFWSGLNRGLWYSVFVAIAFIIATSISYFWNKFWTFSSSAKSGFAGGQSENQISGEEFGKFLTVSAIAGLVSVSVASLVVNLTNPVFGLTLDQWANVGGVAGSAVALVFSFAGFKLAVFRK
ncbi:MAG: hypothetical protein A2655_00765 [Candidatus Yanofskybacteria bacterium RIFCSPHIGHO2_01_FULL_43_42]|uniref:GtrA/DPMS transmembrane domain-containing protein n=1 Tax=Candidatus Yanofskybacteria bacterium RIFCSPLOWO2_01_FULL_43_22 TaxID=1802695 RepID=A0A1F8GHM9_9BACT|nr:MAG: hypothetical protein A2655_00765 [Candidatus Yanofskybacteria bacterium RIFCSPHIGHO2_01_FULL_43_42]OGN13440.1 MAG: hypothetical protein A3D48_01090 [Candidatus Yanofskybacteria bacterium RIFCSPHIGHO2_02_FULL_43_17]OGN24811.1 MAG: hypothetical protein A3A13_04730 [Candidatus Yanofskybacteria bacterium RIFCSPLOWO2_01_FULL_43_22]